MQLSAGPTVLFLPFLNGTVMRAVTPGLMIQHHAIICVHLRSPCYPLLSPFDFSLSSLFSLLIPYPRYSPSIFPLPPLCFFLFYCLFCLFDLFSFLRFVLYFLFPSPPPPYAMSKACQSQPSRQSCQYCSW